MHFLVKLSCSTAVFFFFGLTYYVTRGGYAFTYVCICIY